RRRGLIAGALAAPLAASGLARAQPRAVDWPTQTVRYINLYAPGGATDLASRAYCAAMTAITGVQFVVENRAGAGGTVGQDAIAKSRPDGTTVGLGSVATLAIAPSVFPNLPYHPENDFTFISGLWRQPNLLFVNNDLPARSVPELIDLLKRNPGKYSYGIGGIATTPHLCGEMFKTRTGVDMPVVTYRGGAPALIDLMAGRIQVMFDNFSGPIGAARDGKVRALAVSSPERSPSAPELPALAEFLPGFDITSWNGVVGPAGIPPAMVERMNALTRQALQRPEVIAHYGDNGATPWWTTPEDYKAYRAEQARILAEVVRTSGARIE
ncbi:MAG: tripartite tricarboxylate transporter substrate binding protein, partial [Acetobacteraceae bacterium]|nr:tripartite tricarboxylate transporter substrate binding protein [Acetobacteraceae bacterium]